MKNKNTLDSAIEQMKLGSRKGFLNFYRGTVSYVYSSAYLLYKDRDEALRFMEDLYLYMYLHITDYKGDGDVKKWVSRELLERYRQLMIGKEIPDMNAIQAVQENVELDKEGRKLLETALLSNISFPPQDGSISTTWLVFAVLFVSGVILLAYLIINNVKPKQSIDAGILTEKASENEQTVSSDNAVEESRLKTLSEAQDELDKYLESYGDNDNTDDTGETSVTDIIHNEFTDGVTERTQKSEPDIPQTPVTSDHTIEEPSSKTPEVPDPTAKNKKNKDNSEDNDPNSKIEEFMDKVEEFENYTITP